MGCSGCGGETIREVMAELMAGAGRGVPARPRRTRRVSAAPPGVWRPLPSEVEARLDLIIRGWLGTRYMDNQRVRGGGVDCRHLIAAILDEWSRTPGRTELPPAARDSGIHDKRKGFETARAIRERYPAVIVRDGSLEPGDILVTKAEVQDSALERLGHTMLVSPQRGMAVHATKRGGVHLVNISGREILRNYRAKGKLEWK